MQTSQIGRQDTQRRTQTSQNWKVNVPDMEGKRRQFAQEIPEIGIFPREVGRVSRVDSSVCELV